MSEMAYHLGRLLAFADSLHCLYCQEVRKGEIPPKLIGSAYFPNVRDNPARGLKELSGRIRVYTDWAKKCWNNHEEKGGLANWHLKNLGEISQQLHEAGLIEIRLTDAEQAYMLLGYLAPLKDKHESEPLKQETETPDQQ